MIPRHLYLHAPFCARRCSYCDFAVTVNRSPRKEPWLDAVAREIEGLIGSNGWSRLEPRTIYVGGGTPSLFGPGMMAGLVERLSAVAELSRLEEFTGEANPEHFGVGLAEDWRSAGVNRLSLGAQSFDAGVLRWMGRLHGADGPGRAVRAARDAGFDDISIDLIFGLPSRLGRDWSADLERTLELGTEHISLYGLTAETGAPLGRWVREGRERLADEDEYAAQYLEAARTLTAAGYEHYEVSNFARPGRESRHNGAYWDGAAYIGLGPGAHSYVPPRRWWNVRDHAVWASRIAESGSAIEDAEVVSGEAAVLEQAWLALRTSSGATTATADQVELARGWQDAGLAAVEGETVRLTAEGWLLLDRLAVEFAERGLNGTASSQKLTDPSFETEPCSTG